MQPQQQQPPKVGDKVFIPELQIWGEITEFYDTNSGLITRVRAVVNGKPTVFDVTNLIVDLAAMVRTGWPLLQKLGRAIKNLCQKFGICKKPVPQLAIPEALYKAIEILDTKGSKELMAKEAYLDNQQAIDKLLSYIQ